MTLRPRTQSSITEEYVYNSSATTAADATSFATGTGGVNFAAFTPGGTANIKKRVRFSSAFQVTDHFELQVNDGNGWVSAGSIGMEFTSDVANVNYFGVNYQVVNGSTTDIDVQFFSKPWPHAAWAAVTAWKWRLVRVRYQ